MDPIVKLECGIYACLEGVTETAGRLVEGREKDSEFLIGVVAPVLEAVADELEDDSDDELDDEDGEDGEDGKDGEIPAEIDIDAIHDGLELLMKELEGREGEEFEKIRKEVQDLLDMFEPVEQPST